MGHVGQLGHTLVALVTLQPGIVIRPLLLIPQRIPRFHDQLESLLSLGRIRIVIRVIPLGRLPKRITQSLLCSSRLSIQQLVIIHAHRRYFSRDSLSYQAVGATARDLRCPSLCHIARKSHLRRPTQRAQALGAHPMVSRTTAPVSRHLRRKRHTRLPLQQGIDLLLGK